MKHSYFLTKLLQYSSSKAGKSQSNDSGYILVVTSVLLVTLSSLLVTAAVMSKVNNDSTKASVKSNKGFYASEAGVNLRAKKIKDKFRNFSAPDGTPPDSWKNCQNKIE